jgi:hypothetical protein
MIQHAQNVTRLAAAASSCRPPGQMSGRKLRSASTAFSSAISHVVDASFHRRNVVMAAGYRLHHDAALSLQPSHDCSP